MRSHYTLFALGIALLCGPLMANALDTDLMTDLNSIEMVELENLQAELRTVEASDASEVLSEATTFLDSTHAYVDSEVSMQGCGDCHSTRSTNSLSNSENFRTLISYWKSGNQDAIFYTPEFS